MSGNNKKKWIIRLLVAALVLVLAGGAAIWYIFNEKHADTSLTKADYTVNAFDLIKEFKSNLAASNTKYVDKFVTVNGRISSIEPVDSTMNVKMLDDSSNYIIFAFQQQDFPKLKQLKEGDSTSIKGSCSGGTYSEIQELHYIALNRCSINQ